MAEGNRLKRKYNTIFTTTLRRKDQMAEGHINHRYSIFSSQAEGVSENEIFIQNRSLAVS